MAKEFRPVYQELNKYLERTDQCLKSEVNTVVGGFKISLKNSFFIVLQR